MMLGRIAVGIVIFAIMIGIFVAYRKLDDLSDNVGCLVCIAVMLLMVYCVGSGVYLLIEAELV